MKVLLASSLSGLAFFVGMKHLIPWQPESWDAAGRLALITKCAIVALLPVILAVIIVAAQRLRPDRKVGRVVEAYTSLDINTRLIRNTTEQFVLLLVGLSGLSAYVTLSDALSIPVLTALFLIGRTLFWLGYHHNTFLRAYGFGLTFYPTVVVYVWLMIRMVFGIYIPI